MENSKNTELARTDDLAQIIEQDKIEALLKGEERARKQNFLKILHQSPWQTEGLKDHIRTDNPTNDTPYIPISVVEMMLDQLFFGDWDTKNYRTKQVLNEIVGDIELTVVHPVTGREITRTGSAAVPIQQKKGAEPQEIEKKYTRALEKDYPNVKARATSNAAKSLGRIFGRDLGRSHVAGDYSPMQSEEQTKKVHKSLSEKLEEVKQENGQDEQE